MGNRTARNKDSVVTTWMYDNAYRLTGQQKSGQWATFSYDAAGNTLVKWQEGSSPMSFAYDNANCIVTMLQGTNLTTTKTTEASCSSLGCARCLLRQS